MESHFSIKDRPLSMVVATDTHYLAPSLYDNGPFFHQLIDTADGKYMYYIEELTDAFVDEMVQKHPDFLVLSGDLTFNGEKESHQVLAKKLERIQAAGTQVLVIPGNHDIERSSAASFHGEGYQKVETVSQQEFAEIYGAYGLQNALHKDDHSLSYIYSLRSDVWLLCLDSNSLVENQVSKETLHWVEEMLKEAQKRGIRVIGVSHQNLVAHNPNFQSGFVVDQSPTLYHLYQTYGVLLNISGHIHIQHFQKGEVPEITTTSLAVSPNQYGEIQLDEHQLTYQTAETEVSSWAKQHGKKDPNLLDFAESSRQFMEKVAKTKTGDWPLKDSSTKDLVKKAQETFAQLNADYFAGHVEKKEAYGEGLQVLTNQFTEFTGEYLSSILDESGIDQRRFVLRIDK